jgi:HD-like signal output (HDOD) protein
MAGSAFSLEMTRSHYGPEAHRRVAAIAAELGRRRNFDRLTTEALRAPENLKDLPLEMRKAAGDVLGAARLIDEALEALPHHPASFEQILGDLWGLAVDGTIEPTSVKHVSPPATAQDLARAMDALPVFPSVALKVLRELGREECDLGQVQGLASRDQVLTASLLRIANSALYGACRRVSNLAGAVARIGTDMAAQVVVAAALKPLFASASLQRLWQHSIEAAAVCSDLAGQTRGLAECEGAVLGLVHDIGSLVICMLPVEHAAAHARIAEESGTSVVADYLVCGRDHGELGAALLQRWNFPPEFVEGVRHHHRPERTDSRLAALVYVAEHRTGCEEDTPSLSRLAGAMATAGVSPPENADGARSTSRLEALLNAA